MDVDAFEPRVKWWNDLKSLLSFFFGLFLCVVVLFISSFMSLCWTWMLCVRREQMRLQAWWAASLMYHCLSCLIPTRLVDLVVRCPPRERKIPGSNPAWAVIFSGSSHTSDLKIDTPVATLPGAWHYRVSTGTGRPSVSILWLGKMESLICSFYLSAAARKIVCADPSLRYTGRLLGH